MSSKKLLFIISLVILTGSLMSFNVNPKHSENSNYQIPNSNSIANLSLSLLEFGIWNLEFSKTDTLPGDMQERVAELHRKRQKIREEVQRIKDAEATKIARKAEAEKIALEKEKQKANKEAIAQIKAEEKAKSNAIKKKEKAAKKAEADRLKTIKKAEAQKIALEKKKQREAEAVQKAKVKARQDAITQKDQSRQKAEADRLKAIKKAEADKLKAERKAEAERVAQEKKQLRDAEAALKVEQKAEANRLKTQQDAERKALRDKVATAQANVNTAVSNEDALKAAKKRDAEIAKAAKKKERDALKATKKQEREVKAALRAKQKAEAAAIAQANATNPNMSDDAIKAAKKQEREALKAARVKEREAKAALRAQQKAEAAAIAAQAEAERKARAAAAAEGLVYDEDPPGYEATTPNSVTIPADTAENPRLHAESIEVSNKTDGGEGGPEVITEPILPPPPPANDADEAPSKTKNAVARALAREGKKRKRKGGIKLPGIGGKSDVSNEEILGECDFEFNEFDPITQKVKRGLAHRYFFSYTSDILKEYMQGEDYLVCTGGLIDIQGIIALGIKYEIDSPQARYEYGSIGTNAQMILQLIDGETITLLAEQSDSGRVNRSTGKTEFSSIFLINPREEKELRKTEISTVRMVWGTGYEDYEVNELDFLINQFQCIDAARDN